MAINALQHAHSWLYEKGVKKLYLQVFVFIVALKHLIFLGID